MLKEQSKNSSVSKNTRESKLIEALFRSHVLRSVREYKDSVPPSRRGCGKMFSTQGK